MSDADNDQAIEEIENNTEYPAERELVSKSIADWADEQNLTIVGNLDPETEIDEDVLAEYLMLGYLVVTPEPTTKKGIFHK